MSFQEFLAKLNITSIDDHLKAIQSSLKMKKVIMRRSPNAVNVNNFNRKIISMFKSNMDIQFILDSYACCSYVVNYINKSDRGLSKALESIYNQNIQDNASSTAFDLLRSMATTYCNGSEVSVQEAAYNILRIRMSEASSVTQFIPTARPEENSHLEDEQRTGNS